MNNYFSNIGTKLAKKFHHDSGLSLNQPYALACVKPGSAVLDQVAFSEEKIKLKLTHIKQKIGGPDKITSHDMAAAAESLFEGLFSIFKNSFQCGRLER